MTTFSKDCLDGKVILITGGLGAIGKVIVAELLAHGGRVVVNDMIPEIEAQRKISEASWSSDYCKYVRADIRKAKRARLLVREAAKVFGRLDVVLCHAGIVADHSVIESSEREWDDVMAVNLKGAFLVAQAAARNMIRAKTKGKIIFTSSWVQQVPWPDITLYTVSKSGLMMLMRGMARELATHGIRVNAVAPGIVSVGMAKKQWDTDPKYHARAIKAIPLGFMQPPESVADAFVFLCSEASDYMTGSTLLVDGGCSLYPMD